LGQPLPSELISTVAAVLGGTNFGRHRHSNEQHLTD